MTVADEQRAFLERSLADLDAEHAAGDLSDRDFERLRASYEARLAAVEREPVAVVPAPAAVVRPRRRPRRLWLVAALLVVGAVAGGLLVRSSGSRLPSGVATGAAVGRERTALLLQRAAAASAKGDNVSAIAEYEAVLKDDPNQPVALTQEGWILAQTGQPQLLDQGIGLLSRALQAQPGYPPALVYRGVAQLSRDDYGDAATDLQAYLAGSPDPALVTKVQAALASAKAGLASASTTTTAPKG